MLTLNTVASPRLMVSPSCSTTASPARQPARGCRQPRGCARGAQHATRARVCVCVRLLRARAFVALRLVHPAAVGAADVHQRPRGAVPHNLRVLLRHRQVLHAHRVALGRAADAAAVQLRERNAGVHTAVVSACGAGDARRRAAQQRAQPAPRVWERRTCSSNTAPLLGPAVTVSTSAGAADAAGAFSLPRRGGMAAAADGNTRTPLVQPAAQRARRGA
jgi:hypothetical protein